MFFRARRGGRKGCAPIFVVSPTDEKTDDAKLETAVRAMLKAGGVIADVVILEVDRSDAPRYALDPSDPAAHDKPAKTQDIRTSITQYVGDAAPAITNDDQVLLPEMPGPDDDGFARAQSKLLDLIHDHSSAAQLVVISLPRRRATMAPEAWMDSVDTLAAGLKRVLFVKESGQENVQFFQ